MIVCFCGILSKFVYIILQQIWRLNLHNLKQSFSLFLTLSGQAIFKRSYWNWKLHRMHWRSLRSGQNVFSPQEILEALSWTRTTFISNIITYLLQQKYVTDFSAITCVAWCVSKQSDMTVSHVLTKKNFHSSFFQKLCPDVVVTFCCIMLKTHWISCLLIWIPYSVEVLFSSFAFPSPHLFP